MIFVPFVEIVPKRSIAYFMIFPTLISFGTILKYFGLGFLVEMSKCLQDILIGKLSEVSD